MERPDVVCEVSTCNHWLPGKICGAANIDILNEQGDMPKDSKGTKCKTFSKRGLGTMVASLDNTNWSGVLTEAFKSGKQAVPTITCTVQNCNFWDAGNRCNATGIYVTGNGANTDAETDCHTFVQRGSNR
ncbi:conserved hypothetical protein [Heliomicrobium modesticaldum Ice1]|uniref:DUF1540 domain-containing protein n=1 Tax=Heliobacterium modesticaldum (strain ATCC 51547 / Ice1) TaxID=498761 RepID=B0TD43_HELMI|nr:DUF1540 domain-containing protein [Heliomicrobium modesticaldum]ABZ82741.1 conserved hypothetical protein [Heliomicrobium modesticaldum Ice1]